MYRLALPKDTIQGLFEAEDMALENNCYSDENVERFSGWTDFNNQFKHKTLIDKRKRLKEKRDKELYG